MTAWSPNFELLLQAKVRICVQEGVGEERGINHRPGSGVLCSEGDPVLPEPSEAGFKCEDRMLALGSPSVCVLGALTPVSPIQR